MEQRGDLDGWWVFGIAVVGFFWRILFRTRIEGTEHIPSSGPAIVAGNHVSGLDGVVLALVTGSRGRRMTKFLVAAEFFHKLWCGWALRLYRQIPLRRGERDQGALDVAIETIRGGALAGIFPEGTVNTDPEAGLLLGSPWPPAHRWSGSGSGGPRIDGRSRVCTSGARGGRSSRSPTAIRSRPRATPSRRTTSRRSPTS